MSEARLSSPGRCFNTRDLSAPSPPGTRSGSQRALSGRAEFGGQRGSVGVHVDDWAPAGLGATLCTSSEAGVAAAARLGCVPGGAGSGVPAGRAGRSLAAWCSLGGVPRRRQLGAWPGRDGWAWPAGRGARVGSARGEIRRGGGGPARRMRAALF